MSNVPKWRCKSFTEFQILSFRYGCLIWLMHIWCVFYISMVCLDMVTVVSVLRGECPNYFRKIVNPYAVSNAPFWFCCRWRVCPVYFVMLQTLDNRTLNWIEIIYCPMDGPQNVERHLRFRLQTLQNQSLGAHKKHALPHSCTFPSVSSERAPVEIEKIQQSFRSV
jgi:hypothetical protein